MGRALTTLGYHLFPEPLWYGDASLREDFYAGRLERLKALIEQHDAFEDSPFNHSDFYQWLYREWPGAKFILTVREAANVVGSYKRWFKAIEGPVLEPDRELYDYVKFFFRHEYGQNEPLDDDARMASVYEARNRAVLEFFADRPGQFLAMDLERETSPWQRLCEFLEEPVPSTDFPHLKRTQ